MSKVTTIGNQSFTNGSSVISENWENIGPNVPDNYNPHDPNTFVNPYSGINPQYTAEQLQAHLDSGNHMYKHQMFMFDLWYNSEAEKFKRLKAIGINPLLTGLGDASESNAADSASSASSSAGSIAAQSQSTMVEREAKSSQIAVGVATTILSAIASFFNVALGAAVSAAGVALNKSLAKKAEADAQLIQTNIDAVQTATDIAIEQEGDNLAKSYFTAAYQNAYSPDKTIEQIMESVTMPTKFSSNSKLNAAALAHAPKYFKSYDLLNNVISGRSKSLRTMYDLGKNSFYDYSESDMNKMFSDYSTTILTFDLDKMQLESDYNYFKSLILNGQDPSKVAEMFAKKIDSQSNKYSWEANYYKHNNSYAAAASINSEYESKIAKHEYFSSYYNSLDSESAASAINNTNENISNYENVRGLGIRDEAVQNIYLNKRHRMNQEFLYQLERDTAKVYRDALEEIKQGKFGWFKYMGLRLCNLIHSGVHEMITDFDPRNLNGGFTAGDVLQGAVDMGTSVGEMAINARQPKFVK